MLVRQRAAAAALSIAVLVAGGCSRGGDETEVGGPTTTAADAPTTTAGPESRLDAAGFGDLENVCGPGEAAGGATDVGVTADSINVGTLTDKGFASRPGLNEEMLDAAEAFAAWCNEHGGINGREIVVHDRDAALTAYNDRITESCAEDFALVGGGAVLDDADNGGRVACGLPNVAGYVVSQTARDADLQIQPVPNPSRGVRRRRLPAAGGGAPRAHGPLRDHDRQLRPGPRHARPGAPRRHGELGFQDVYSQEYNSGGESNWRPFVEGMRDAGVEVFEFVGEPEYFSALQEAMAQVGFYPEVIMVQTNMYDTRYLDLVGDSTRNTLIRTAYTPFELADENPATADYLELMERYNPSGKLAQLGAQAVSSFLLFAQAASACGAELTRACLMEQRRHRHRVDRRRAARADEPGGGTAPECFTVIAVTPGAFTIDEAFTEPNDGIFNCDPANVIPTPTG